MPAACHISSYGACINWYAQVARIRVPSVLNRVIFAVQLFLAAIVEIINSIIIIRGLTADRLMPTFLLAFPILVVAAHYIVVFHGKSDHRLSGAKS